MQRINFVLLPYRTQLSIVAHPSIAVVPLFYCLVQCFTALFAQWTRFVRDLFPLIPGASGAAVFGIMVSSQLIMGKNILRNDIKL